MNQYLVCDWSAIHPMVSAVVLQHTGSVTMSPMWLTAENIMTTATGY